MEPDLKYFKLETTKGEKFKLKEDDVDIRGNIAFEIEECKHDEKPIECVLLPPSSLTLPLGLITCIETCVAFDIVQARKQHHRSAVAKTE